MQKKYYFLRNVVATAICLAGVTMFAACESNENEDENPDNSKNPALTGKVKSINGDSVIYNAEGYVAGINQMVYNEDTGVETRQNVMFDGNVSIKGGTIGGNADYHVHYIYFIDDNSIYDYAYYDEKYENRLSEIRYNPNDYQEFYFVSQIQWNSGDLYAVVGDQKGVSRDGYLSTTFEYSTQEYPATNFDISFCMALQEYYAGTMFIFFDGNLGAGSKHLITKKIQKGPAYEGEKYDLTETYRYEFNADGYITKVFSTLNWDGARPEELALELEYY
ncbi:MAG: hypothetical protein LBR66_01440 [Candidatus Symbiothrix sp.]|jgi:hypothetical protein|nr:hypothetical protein [Candidatus Symbiothrix sp.]